MAWCQQQITWANVDPYLCCHMASLGSTELCNWQQNGFYFGFRYSIYINNVYFAWNLYEWILPGIVIWIHVTRVLFHSNYSKSIFFHKLFPLRKFYSLNTLFNSNISNSHFGNKMVLQAKLLLILLWNERKWHCMKYYLGVGYGKYKESYTVYTISCLHSHKIPQESLRLCNIYASVAHSSLVQSMACCLFSAKPLAEKLLLFLS